MNLVFAPVSFSSAIFFSLVLSFKTILALDTAPAPELASPIMEESGLGKPVFLAEEDQPRISAMGGESPTNGLIFYDHGDPTDYEQLMLELVNRARADPGAEAARLGIDLNENLSPGTIADTPKQPLGSHRFLIDAARGHSQWMLDNDVFSHTGEGGSSPSVRAQMAGYPGGAGENIAWGGTTGAVNPEASTRARHDGLFISPGHRLNICKGSYREIGLGILLGQFFSSGTNYNSLMATQNFGSSSATPWPFVVGAAYYDFNENGFYDPGEGIGGIEVNIDGGDYYTTTASAGGYTLPRPSAAGMREVTMVAPALAESFVEDLPAGTNHKVDLALEYTPPTLIGATLPAVDQANYYAISPVPGATSFEVKALSAIPADDDGANDLSQVIDGTSGSYSALSGSVKFEGSAAYHFAHVSISEQTLEYSPTFRPGPAGELHFRSRLGYATADQVAHVEVSQDGGDTWTPIYSQPGSGSSGEGSFQARSVSLAAYTDQLVQIRFNYRFAGGSLFSGDSDGVGWYVDAITFADIAAVELLEEATVAPGATHAFLPPSTGTVLLTARPQNLDRWWPTGQPVQLDVAAGLGYGTWAHNWELSADLPAGSLTGSPMEATPGQGTPNVVAYALGLDPTVPAADQLPGWVASATGPVFEYTVDTSATEASVTPEISTDLQSWHPVGAAALGFDSEDQLSSSAGTVETRRVVLPNTVPTNAFFRVRVEMP